MAKYICTDRCVQWTAKHCELTICWTETWPETCSICDGVGELREPGSWEEPPWREPCDCVIDDACPRCGATGQFVSDDPDDDNGKLDLIDRDFHCERCGWRSWKQQSWVDYVPEPPECLCWEKEIAWPTLYK